MRLPCLYCSDWGWVSVQYWTVFQVVQSCQKDLTDAARHTRITFFSRWCSIAQHLVPSWRIIDRDLKKHRTVQHFGLVAKKNQSIEQRRRLSKVYY
jgi:hypothetical protein